MKESNAPRTQASTGFTRTTTAANDDDNSTDVEDYDMPDTYGNDWSYLTGQPPGYDKFDRPESLWQPYYPEGHDNKLETVGKLRHLVDFALLICYT